MRSGLFAFVRFCAAVLVLAIAVLAPRVARAGGTVTVTDASPKEDEGKWKLKMTMNFGGVPPTAHIPMNFEFTQTVLYERSLTDASPKTPVLTKKALQNQTPINESMDVGFSDASGKIFNITKFDFVIRRDHGFEAGEYNLVITRTSDGAKMGSAIKITLQGDNEVVDRRAMVFSGEKPKKADEKKADEKKDDPVPSDAAPSGSAVPGEGEGGDVPPVETPPATPPKQGGCGCRVADPTPDSAFGIAAIAGIALLAERRRRRAPRIHQR